jgi:hypothetical protein
VTPLNSRFPLGYTLLANCRAQDLDPEVYLAEVIKRLPPDATPDQAAVLPPPVSPPSGEQRQQLKKLPDQRRPRPKWTTQRRNLASSHIPRPNSSAI